MITQIGMPLVIALPPAKCLRLSAQPALTRVGPDADIANWADLICRKALKWQRPSIPFFTPDAGGEIRARSTQTQLTWCYHVY